MHPPHETLSRRWGPGLISAIPMSAAYIALGIVVPRWLMPAGQFLIGLAGVSFVAGLILGLVCRAAGMYSLDAAGLPRFNAPRQGNTATQLALLLSWPIFAQLGINHSFWVYLIAYFLVAAVGRIAFGLAARQAGAQPPRSSLKTTFQQRTPTYRTENRSEPAKVAPRWLRRTARVCLAFALIAIARLAVEQELIYLWVALACLFGALILPSLVVALDGGQNDDQH